MSVSVFIAVAATNHVHVFHAPRPLTHSDHPYIISYPILHRYTLYLIPGKLMTSLWSLDNDRTGPERRGFLLALICSYLFSSGLLLAIMISF